MADHASRPAVDLLSGAFWAGNHHEAFTWMRANDPVYWDGTVWGVSRYADLKAVSKDPATFSNAEGIRAETGAFDQLIDLDDPAHMQRRKLVNRGFTPKRVRDREARIRQVCDEIIDRVCERGACDFVWDIAAPLPLIMIGDDLGVAPEHRDQLLRWSDAMLCALGDPGAAGPAAEAFVGYTDYVTRVIADRKAAPRDDLMSVLCHAEIDGDRLDDSALIHDSLLILIGGDETTRHVISGGGWQLLADRDQWEKLAADPTRLECAVEEMLRWVTPIKNMNRTATRDVELAGQQIHAGDKVLLLYPSANRDEDVFDEPFRFDIERSPNEHVAFGFGSHFCLGASLARLELRVMFERLLTRLPDLALADAAEPAARPANFISGYESMPVTFTPTAPLTAAG